MSDNNILVLGANGMLGKMVSLYLKSNNELNVFVTSRSKNSFIEKNFLIEMTFPLLPFNNPLQKNTSKPSHSNGFYLCK